MTNLANIPLFNTIDRSLGELMANRSSDDSGLVEIASALTSYALRQGHVCLETSTLSASEFAQFFTEDFFADIAGKLQGIDLVGSESEEMCPLILSKTKKLYFHRYWHYEKKLLNKVQHRISSKRTETSSTDSKQLLDSFSVLGEQQKEAVLRAIDSPLTLVSGGPGTGKTTTVLHILVQLVQRKRDRPLRIGLAAPTGKAAQRIKLSLEQGLKALPIEDTVKQAIPIEAVTLHRLLGYIRNSSQFRHNQEVPLPYDFVIVDEASMLDLLLLSKLLNALHSETQLVLLGDRHQLASVEAGSIFGDLVLASQSQSLLRECTVELTQNYRFGDKSDLFQTCEFVKAGQADDALLNVQNAGQEISLRSLPIIPKMKHTLEDLLALHFLEIAKAEDAQSALSKIEELCLLTPIRKGSYGVEGLNASMESILRKKLNLPNQTKHFSGQPILITQNSYSQSLFNGDLGVLFPSEDNRDELFAYFRDNDANELRRFPLSALPAYELAFAMTVHKSQGSEYRRVVFVIPPSDTPIVTRELIYTAISRSRQQVEILSNPENFVEGIQRQTLRASGILNGMISPNEGQ